MHKQARLTKGKQQTPSQRLQAECVHLFLPDAKLFNK